LPDILALGHGKYYGGDLFPACVFGRSASMPAVHEEPVAVAILDELNRWECFLITSSEEIGENLDPLVAQLFAWPQLGVADDLG